MKKIIASVICLLVMLSLFRPVNAEQSSIDSSNTSKWQKGNITYTDELNSVTCFQNNIYITVGNGGTIRTSQDGIKWTGNINTSNSTSELYDVVCNNDQIIAVGEKGTILRSTDGFNWIAIKPVTDSTIMKVIYSKDLFLAFTDKKGEILTSKGGVNWNSGKITSKENIYDAVWNGKVFVAVGDKGEISTSKDGFTWQTKILKNKPSFDKVAWNGKMFVAYGAVTVDIDEFLCTYTSGQYIASSKDGYSWNIKTIKTKSFNKKSPVNFVCDCQNIIWNGKSFVIIINEKTGQGSVDSRMIAYTSNNGIDWKRNQTNIGGDSFVTVWTGKSFAAVCNYFTLPGYYYCYIIYNSKDGVTWNKVAEDNKMDKNANDIIYANGKIVSVGAGGEIRSSEDGVHWNNNDTIHYPQLWDGKRFLSLDSTTYQIYSSIDGLLWKKENQIDWNITYGKIFWSGIEYITFGPNYLISTSKDLITWNNTKYDYNGDLYTSIGRVAAFDTNGKRYVLAGNNGTAVSSDLKSWECRKAENYYKSVAVGDSSFVAVNTYGQIDVSVDGLKWKRVFIKNYNDVTNKIIYGRDKFIGVGKSGEVWYSIDGAKWTKADSKVNKNLIDICWTGNEFIAAGDEGTIITSEDGLQWQQEESPLKINFTNICSNGKMTIINSANGFVYKCVK